MTDPRTALDQLMRALEVFHEAAASTNDPDSDAVVDATDDLADAYVIYDDAVFRRYNVELPFDIYDDEDDDEDDDFDDDLDDDDDDDDRSILNEFDDEDDDLEPLD